MMGSRNLGFIVIFFITYPLNLSRGDAEEKVPVLSISADANTHNSSGFPDDELIVIDAFSDLNATATMKHSTGRDTERRNDIIRGSSNLIGYIRMIGGVADKDIGQMLIPSSIRGILQIRNCSKSSWDSGVSVDGNEKPQPSLITVVIYVVSAYFLATFW